MNLAFLAVGDMLQHFMLTSHTLKHIILYLQFVKAHGLGGTPAGAMSHEQALSTGRIDFVVVEDNCASLGKLLEEKRVTSVIECVACEIQVKVINVVAQDTGITREIVVAGNQGKVLCRLPCSSVSHTVKTLAHVSCHVDC